jgi:hypothetical protein
VYFVGKRASINSDFSQACARIGLRDIQLSLANKFDHHKPMSSASRSILDDYFNENFRMFNYKKVE